MSNEDRSNEEQIEAVPVSLAESGEAADNVLPEDTAAVENVESAAEPLALPDPDHVEPEAAVALPSTVVDLPVETSALAVTHRYGAVLADDEDEGEDDGSNDYDEVEDGEIAENEIDAELTEAAWLDGEEEMPVSQGEIVRHVHRFYSSELLMSEDETILAEQQYVIEHTHESSGPHDKHIIGGGEEVVSSTPEPFIPQQSEPEGFLIPRQPEQSESSGERPRRPVEPRTRIAAPTRAQMDAGMIMATKSRMPAKVLARQLLAYAERERKMALDVRDPIAIAFAAERFNVLAGLLAENGPEEEVDLLRPVLTVSQAAKMLGYNAKELRRLLGQGKVVGRKVGSEWRIPLRAVL